MIFRYSVILFFCSAYICFFCLVLWKADLWKYCWDWKRYRQVVSCWKGCLLLISGTGGHTRVHVHVLVLVARRDAGNWGLESQAQTLSLWWPSRVLLFLWWYRIVCFMTCRTLLHRGVLSYVCYLRLWLWSTTMKMYINSHELFGLWFFFFSSVLISFIFDQQWQNDSWQGLTLCMRIK